MDKQGRLIKGGKVMTQGAIEQRLRRFCKVRKNGSKACGEDIFKMWNDTNQREDLIEQWKSSLCNRVGGPGSRNLTSELRHFL